MIFFIVVMVMMSFLIALFRVLIFMVNTENLFYEVTHEESSVDKKTNGTKYLEDSTKETTELRKEVKNGHNWSVVFYFTVREEEVGSKEKFGNFVFVS